MLPHILHYTEKPSTTENYPVQNVDGVMFEKPWPKGVGNGEALKWEGARDIWRIRKLMYLEHREQQGDKRREAAK